MPATLSYSHSADFKVVQFSHAPDGVRIANTQELVDCAFAAGAFGYVSKNAPEQLVNAAQLRSERTIFLRGVTGEAPRPKG